MLGVGILIAAPTALVAAEDCDGVCLPPREASDCKQLVNSEKDDILTRLNKCNQNLRKAGKVEQEKDELVGRLNSVKAENKRLEKALKMADRDVGKSQAVKLTDKVGEILAIGTVLGAGVKCFEAGGCSSSKQIATIPVSGAASWAIGEGLEWVFYNE